MKGSKRMKEKRYILPNKQTSVVLNDEWKRSFSIEKFRILCKNQIKQKIRLITNESVPKQMSYSGEIKIK